LLVMVHTLHDPVSVTCRYIKQKIITPCYKTSGSVMYFLNKSHMF
jgi:hypothetical protein